MAFPYVPDAGDIVWLDFDPQGGREQAGHRPAVVLSKARYNDKASLMICCPITTKIKNYPFEMALSGQPASFALSDQVKNQDWRVRNARKKGRVTHVELAQIRANLAALIG
jgi:mRNA interferase MazF